MPFSFIEESLNKREENNLLRRTKKLPKNAIDFASNDYLGLLNLKSNYDFSEIQSGAGASRLIAGNSKKIEDLEKQIAEFHNSESALLYTSGYAANIGLFQALGKRNVNFLVDSQIHASIKDGIRLSFGKLIKFKHNSVGDLKKKLMKLENPIFIVIESVYSMSGNVAPIQEIVEIAKQFKAQVIIDEAHSVGIFGENGRGISCSLALEEEIFARIFAYGKAYATQGASIACSSKVKQYLINFSRSFIYSTGISPLLVKAINDNYELVEKLDNQRNKLFELSHKFNLLFSDLINNLSYNSPIKFIVIAGNEKLKNLCKIITKYNFFIVPILSPTVRNGNEGIRIVLHSFNTEEQMVELNTIIRDNI